MDTQKLDAAINEVIKSAKVLADAKGAEMLCGTKRQIIKPEAIARLMMKQDELTGKEYSATAAEKVVVLDPTYADCLRDERNATAYTIEAMGVYEAAKLRARMLIMVADVTELKALKVTLGKDLSVEVG